MSETTKRKLNAMPRILIRANVSERKWKNVITGSYSKRQTDLFTDLLYQLQEINYDQKDTWNNISWIFFSDKQNKKDKRDDNCSDIGRKDHRIERKYYESKTENSIRGDCQNLF